MGHHPHERVFATRPVKPDGVHVVAALYIRCGHDGCEESVDYTSTGRGKTNPDHAIKSWRRKGWDIGRNADGDRCPQHTRTALKEAEMQRRTPIQHTSHEKDFGAQLRSASAVAATLDAKPSRLPTREESQLIYMAVQEAYPVADQGYAAGATDDSIAAELGLPRVFVAQVRDQFFGPAVVVDPRIAALELRAAALEAQGRQILEEVAAFGASMQQYRQDLDQLKKGATP